MAVADNFRGTRLAYVVGPGGRVITTADLPSSGPIKWTARRKAELVLAVDGGLLSVETACRRYELSMDEFQGWRSALRELGTLGLRATRIRGSRSEIKEDRR
jgi:Protein of unknown function (DUF1153)